MKPAGYGANHVSPVWRQNGGPKRVRGKEVCGCGWGLTRGHFRGCGIPCQWVLWKLTSDMDRKKKDPRVGNMAGVECYMFGLTRFSSIRLPLPFLIWRHILPKNPLILSACTTGALFTCLFESLLVIRYRLILSNNSGHLYREETLVSCVPMLNDWTVIHTCML